MTIKIYYKKIPWKTMFPNIFNHELFGDIELRWKTRGLRLTCVSYYTGLLRASRKPCAFDKELVQLIALAKQRLTAIGH